MMCGIDEAIRMVRNAGLPETIVNRFDYHRRQAEGVKPKYRPGPVLKDSYTCGNCGFRVIVQDNFCPNCGFSIKWDSCRCLTGLPLVDLAEVEG